MRVVRCRCVDLLLLISVDRYVGVAAGYGAFSCAEEVGGRGGKKLRGVTQDAASTLDFFPPFASSSLSGHAGLRRPAYGYTKN